MTDVDELRRLAPPAPGVVLPPADARDAALARVLATPRRSRRRSVRRVAVGAVAVAGIVAALAVWVSARETQGVRISLNGPGTANAPATGGPAVEVEIEVSPAPGVSLAGDALLERAETVLKARGQALSIDGFAVRRGDGNHLIATVPRAESKGSTVSPEFVTAPGFAVYRGGQIVVSESSPTDLVERLGRMRGDNPPGSWFAILETGSRRSYTPQMQQGPFASPAAAAAAFSGPSYGFFFNGIPGRSARTRVVGIPKGLRVVLVSGLPPGPRHHGPRNGYFAVKGDPVLTGEDLVRVDETPSTRAVELTANGGNRLSRLNPRSSGALHGGYPWAIAAVGTNGSAIDPQTSGGTRLVLAEPYSIRPPKFRQPSIIHSRVGSTTLYLLDGGAGSLQMTATEFRQTGTIPQRTGTPIKNVPKAVERTLRDLSKSKPDFYPACCKPIGIETLREMVKVQAGPKTVRLLTGLTSDGLEVTFITGSGHGRGASTSGCTLPVDSPAVQPCVSLGSFSARHPVPGDKLIAGRVARDIARVEAIVGNATIRGAVANGWFILPVRLAPAVSEIVARNASGAIVGRNRLMVVVPDG